MNKKLFTSICLAILAVLIAFPSSALAAGGPLGDWFPIAIGSDVKMQPAVAYHSQHEEYLVVYSSGSQGNSGIYGEIVMRNGMLYYKATITISNGGGVERRNPDVVYNDLRGEFLVVWEHYIPPTSTRSEVHEIRGIVLRPINHILRPVGGEIIIAKYGQPGCYVGCVREKPAVAFASKGKHYLVVWEHNVHMNMTTDVYAQVLTVDGSLSGINFPIAQGTWDYSLKNPDLAYNKRQDKFMVVWEHQFSPDNSDIFGQMVDGSGGLVGGMIPVIFGMGSVWENEANPSIAAISTVGSTGQFLIAAERYHPSNPDNKDIVAIFATGDGTPCSGSFYVAQGPANESNPAVAGSETGEPLQYLVTWSMPVPIRPPTPMIHARTISSTGAQDPITLLGGSFSTYSAVASGPNGDFLVASELPNTSWNIIGWLWGGPILI